MQPRVLPCVLAGQRVSPPAPRLWLAAPQANMQPITTNDDGIPKVHRLANQGGEAHSAYWGNLYPEGTSSNIKQQPNLAQTGLP